MDHFGLMCCIEHNQEKKLIVGLSSLTYRLWKGSVYYIENNLDIINNKNFPKSTSKCFSYNFESGVSDTCWLNHESFISGTDEGDLIFTRYDPLGKKFLTLMSFKEHDSGINSLDRIYGGNIALSASQDTYIKLWDLKAQMSVKTYKAHDNGVTSVSFNRNDSQCFLSCSQDGSCLAWDQRKEKPAVKLNFVNMGYPSCSDWCEVDSNIIAIGSECGYLSLFDTRNFKECLTNLELHERMITKVRFNKRYIASCSEDCRTCVTTIPENEAILNEIYINTEHTDYVKSLSWIPNTDEYLTCSWDGLVKHHIINNNAIL